MCIHLFQWNSICNNQILKYYFHYEKEQERSYNMYMQQNVILRV